MYWWASTMSSRPKTRSMLGRQAPASTWWMILCSTVVPVLPLRSSLWKAVSLVPDGIIATGFEAGDRPPAERACHAHRPAAADQVQRVHDRAGPDEVQDVVRAVGPNRAHARRQRPAAVDERVVGAGRGQRAGLAVPPGRGR